MFAISVRDAITSSQGVQKEAYKFSFLEVSTGSLVSLNLHYPTNLAELDLNFQIELDEVRWDLWLPSLKVCGARGASAVLKTYLSFWATSSRYHDGIRTSCFFGCSSTDTLFHYLRCVPCGMPFQILQIMKFDRSMCQTWLGWLFWLF